MGSSPGHSGGDGPESPPRRRGDAPRMMMISGPTIDITGKDAVIPPTRNVEWSRQSIVVHIYILIYTYMYI